MAPCGLHAVFDNYGNKAKKWNHSDQGLAEYVALEYKASLPTLWVENFPLVEPNQQTSHSESCHKNSVLLPVSEVQVVLLNQLSANSLVWVLPNKLVQSCLIPCIHIDIDKHRVNPVYSVMSHMILPIPSRLHYAFSRNWVFLLNRQDWSKGSGTIWLLNLLVFSAWDLEQLHKWLATLVSCDLGLCLLSCWIQEVSARICHLGCKLACWQRLILRFRLIQPHISVVLKISRLAQMILVLAGRLGTRRIFRFRQSTWHNNIIDKLKIKI